MGDSSDAGNVIIDHDQSLEGKQVVADGGVHIEGTIFASREEFKGTLTGRRMIQGDPPWRWLEITNLEPPPDDPDATSVWVEESYVFFA